MRRWFPALALVAISLWVVVVAAMVSGRPARVVVARFDLAASTTLAVHLVGFVWSWATRPKLTADSVPGWVLVQMAKHRRRGFYFALWGLAFLGLGWVVAHLDHPPSGTLGPAVGFGAAWNLGFQPVVLVAEGLGIAAQSRLSRSGWVEGRKV